MNYYIVSYICPSNYYISFICNIW